MFSIFSTFTPSILIASLISASVISDLYSGASFQSSYGTPSTVCMSAIMRSNYSTRSKYESSFISAGRSG